MNDEAFPNPSRRAIVWFLRLAALFALVGAMPLLVLMVLGHGRATADSRGGYLVLAAIMAPLTIAMLLSALLTWPSARITDRTIEAFRRGEVLARWDYPAEMWDAYVTSALRQSRRNAAILLAVIFLPLIAMAGWVGYAVPQKPTRKIEACAIAVAACLAAAGGAHLLTRLALRRRHARMVACPRAYLAPTAVYCAGTFNFWASQLRELRQVSIEPALAPGGPQRLVLVIGMSRGARRVARAADVINTLALRPTATSSYIIRQEIPIPPGDEARAREIVAQLRGDA